MRAPRPAGLHKAYVIDKDLGGGWTISRRSGGTLYPLLDFFSFEASREAYVKEADARHHELEDVIARCADAIDELYDMEPVRAGALARFFKRKLEHMHEGGFFWPTQHQRQVIHGLLTEASRLIDEGARLLVDDSRIIRYTVADYLDAVVK